MDKKSVSKGSILIMSMTWEQMVQKLKYRKVPIEKLGNRGYLRSTRKITENDWYGELRGVRFCIELSKGADSCILSSKERLKDLEDALRIILKTPASTLGVNIKNTLKYETIFASSGDLLELVVRERKKIGFRPYVPQKEMEA